MEDALRLLFEALSKGTQNMQTVQIGYGKINFPKKSMTLTGFVTEDGFKRTLVSKRYTKVGRTNVQPVSNNPEHDGYLYTEPLALL